MAISNEPKGTNEPRRTSEHHGTNGTNGINGINGNVPKQPEARYLNFPALKHGTIIDGKQALNRWSSTITRGEKSRFNKESKLIDHRPRFPRSPGRSSIRVIRSLLIGEAMLYAAGVPNRVAMKTHPQVG
jgi:dihydroxy-acid dehydratase